MNGAPRATECLSDLTLDRLLSSDLPEPPARAARAHLATCPTCAARHAELTADRATFMERAPSLERLLARSKPPLTPAAALSAGDKEGGGFVAPRAAPTSESHPFARAPSVSADSASKTPASSPREPARAARRTPRTWTGLSLAAAAVVALGVGLRGLDRSDPEPSSSAAPSSPRAPTPSGVRTKGSGVALGFVVRRDGANHDGHAGDILHPGDVLRFTLTTSRPGYAAVWGIDARGVVSAFSEGQLAPVALGEQQVLPGAIELDESAGDERLVAVLCDRPLPIRELTRALAASTSTPQLPEGCASDSLPIRKEPR